MHKSFPYCIERVGDQWSCLFCNGLSIKYGKSGAGKQRYLCKTCGKTFVDFYTKQSFLPKTDREVRNLLKEGMGIRSISRYLSISKNTVLSRILKIAGRIRKPAVFFNHTYEVDEQYTYVQNKESGGIWITYALCRETKAVADFTIGDRTNISIGRVVLPLLLSNPLKIYTDGLINYKSLIPRRIHSTRRGGTNHIERQNLSNRIDLKRLNRDTICYSKSVLLLAACLKIYFWG